jgi:hypothetical protein
MSIVIAYKKYSFFKKDDQKYMRVGVEKHSWCDEETERHTLLSLFDVGSQYIKLLLSSGCRRNHRKVIPYFLITAENQRMCIH